jgi:hypothetical protein
VRTDAILRPTKHRPLKLVGQRVICEESGKVSRLEVIRETWASKVGLIHPDVSGERRRRVVTTRANNLSGPSLGQDTVLNEN